MKLWGAAGASRGILFLESFGRWFVGTMGMNGPETSVYT